MLNIVQLLSQMSESLHSIRAAAQLTGLTEHVIRIWEKRYQAVRPTRTETNRRLYSDEEIERLSLLRDLTLAGYLIGQVAPLPTEKLRTLHSKSAGDALIAKSPAAHPPVLAESLAAVRKLDSRALESALKRGATEFGGQGLLQRVIAPLAQEIGDLWRDGTITAAHEHFATAVIRLFLGHAVRSFAATEGAPVLVVCTPSGQLHELGALLAGAAAANLGWNVTYLGASLPAAEIVGAARQNRARAVALSLVYPEDDPRMANELTQLRDLLPAEIPILVGGRAMPAYREILTRIGAVQIKDLPHLCSALDELRKNPKHR